MRECRTRRHPARATSRFIPVGVQELRESEVEDLDRVCAAARTGQEDIGGLQVPMQDAVGVGEVNALRDLLEDFEGIGPRGEARRVRASVTPSSSSMTR